MNGKPKPNSSNCKDTFDANEEYAVDSDYKQDLLFEFQGETKWLYTNWEARIQIKFGENGYGIIQSGRSARWVRIKSKISFIWTVTRKYYSLRIKVALSMLPNIFLSFFSDKNWTGVCIHKSFHNYDSA